MLKLSFYVPSHSLEAVKNACFSAGAGKVGDYERCAWQTLGQGQFLPVGQAQPAQGCVGQLEIVEEYQVEMVLEKALADKVVQALKQAHPYEEPAYSVVEMLDI